LVIRLWSSSITSQAEGCVRANRCEAGGINGFRKDRIGVSMIRAAEEAGLIQPGKTILVEPLATPVLPWQWWQLLNYRLILTMPDSMSQERQAMLKAYGAQLKLTPGTKWHERSSLQKKLRKTPNAFMPQQFHNSNPKSTGKQQRRIWADTNGEVDFLVAGVGTGGTFAAVAEG